MVKRTHESIRIFRSDFLEFFTHVHPLTPLIVWGPIISYLLWRSVEVHRVGLLAMALSALSGLLVWTLTEYSLHRFVFHYPAKSRAGKYIVFLMHGIHHDDPQDPTRLVMPPVVSLVLGALFFGLFRFLLGPVWVEPFFGFFLLGYLWYDYTHYATHHFPMRSGWGKMIKRHHMLHHFVEHDARMGVSSPLWDYVFGTMKSSVPARAR